MALYEEPGVPESKVHDFHVPIAPSGLYWTFGIDGENLRLRQNGRAATLQVAETAHIDEPKFPMLSPVYAAIKTFRIRWQAAEDQTTLEDASKYFKFAGYAAEAKGEFAVVVPELNFSFTGEATSTVAFLGSEVNGYYYMQGESPPEQPSAPTGINLPSGPLAIPE